MANRERISSRGGSGMGVICQSDCNQINGHQSRLICHGSFFVATLGTLGYFLVVAVFVNPPGYVNNRGK